MKRAESDQHEHAFEARAVAQLLIKDRTFMESYKEAARNERIDAVSFGGRNYVVVHDAEILADILRLAPSAARYEYDPATGRVVPVRG